MVFFHIPANEAGRKSDEGDFEPIRVISEEIPTHMVEGDLDKVNKRLRDEKEDKNFEGGV